MLLLFFVAFCVAQLPKSKPSITEESLGPEAAPRLGAIIGYANLSGHAVREMQNRAFHFPLRQISFCLFRSHTPRI